MLLPNQNALSPTSLLQVMAHIWQVSGYRPGLRSGKGMFIHENVCANVHEDVCVCVNIHTNVHENG